MQGDLGFGPFVSIWFSPRATIRHIVDTNPRQYTWMLIGVASFFALLDTLAARVPLDPPVSIGGLLNLGLWGSVLVAALVAPLGIPSLPPMAIVYRWVSGWFRGVATRPEVTSVIAWSMWPLITTWIVSWTVQLAMFGGAAITGGANPSGAQSAVVVLLALGQIVSAIFGIVIMVAGLAEVSRISIGESVAANIIATMILFVPLLVIAVVLGVVVGFLLAANM